MLSFYWLAGSLAGPAFEVQVGQGSCHRFLICGFPAAGVGIDKNVVAENAQVARVALRGVVDRAVERRVKQSIEIAARDFRPVPQHLDGIGEGKRV